MADEGPSPKISGQTLIFIAMIACLFLFFIWSALTTRRQRRRRTKVVLEGALCQLPSHQLKAYCDVRDVSTTVGSAWSALSHVHASRWHPSRRR